MFYGLQLTMGYFLMLVIMTYSGPLFMCVIFGLMGGHVLFNAKDAFFPLKTTAAVKEAAPDCDCDEEGHKESCWLKGNKVDSKSGNSTSEEGKSSCCMVSNQDEDSEVPEGSTPCCQNEL